MLAVVGVRALTVLGAVSLLLAGCWAEVRQLDGGSKGAADGDPTASGVARLSQIQRTLFDKHCVTDCHDVVGAAAGLPLARDRSYGALVNQRSQQIASQIRVVPGSPTASYLIKKLEGGSGIVGDQMPKAAPLRPASEVDLVRAWIARGAPND